MLGAPMCAHAASAADTVTVIDSPSKVVITTREGHTTVQVVERAGVRPAENAADMAVNSPFGGDGRSLSGHRGKVLFMNGVFGGVVVPVDKPAGMLTSWEVGVTDLLGYSYRISGVGPRISAGAGFAYRWFNVGDGYGVVREGDRMVLMPVSAGDVTYSDPKSRFNTWSLLLTFSLKQNIYKKFAVSLSAIVDFNIYTDAFFEYSGDGPKPVHTKVNYKDFHQRVMRCDLMATAGLSGIAGIYVRYSPSPLFRSDYGPKFGQIAAGMTFFF